jgi:hypothetical protein
MFLPEMDILEQTLYGIMSIVYKDQAAYHINRDSTSIPAQEKAVKKREEEVSSESPQRTDGRGEGGDMPDLGGLTAAAGGINLEKIEEFALALEGGARPCFFRRLEFDGLAINGQEGMRSFRLIQDTRSAIRLQSATSRASFRAAAFSFRAAF